MYLWVLKAGLNKAASCRSYFKRQKKRKGEVGQKIVQKSKGRSKTLGGVPQGKNYSGGADNFSEDNPFATVSFG